MNSVKEAAVWAAELYEQRTILIAQGEGHISYAHSAYRVPWNEVLARFPDLKGPEPRREFQPLFDKEIKKRSLWKVLQGKQKADEWFSQKQTP
jgi:hypothetical protein